MTRKKRERMDERASKQPKAQDDDLQQIAAHLADLGLPGLSFDRRGMERTLARAERLIEQEGLSSEAEDIAGLRRCLCAAC